MSFAAPLDIPTAAATLKPTSSSLIRSTLSAGSFIYSPRSWLSTLGWLIFSFFVMHMPTCRIARNSILSYLKDGITVGSLEIIEEDGTRHLFGTRTKGGNNVVLEVTDDHFWSSLFMFVLFFYCSCEPRAHN